jgi:hypothetical protein
VNPPVNGGSQLTRSFEMDQSIKSAGDWSASGGALETGSDGVKDHGAGSFTAQTFIGHPGLRLIARRSGTIAELCNGRAQQHAHKSSDPILGLSVARTHAQAMSATGRRFGLGFCDDLAVAHLGALSPLLPTQQGGMQ